MTQLFPRQTYYSGTAVSVATTGDKLVLDPARPIVVTEWGLAVSTALTGTPKITCNLRPTAGSTAGQTVGSSSSSTGPVGQTIYTDTAGGQMSPGAVAAGQSVVHRVLPEPGVTAAPNGLTSSTSSQGLLVQPGQEVALNVATAAGAGAGQLFITYYELPNVGDSNAAGSLNYDANVTAVQI